jgi:hypothetical protein
MSRFDKLHTNTYNRAQSNGRQTVYLRSHAHQGASHASRFARLMDSHSGFRSHGVATVCLLAASLLGSAHSTAGRGTAVGSAAPRL